jgi:hypothetical protein
MIRKTMHLIAGFCIATFSLQAQSSSEQIWFEYMLNFPFANSFNLENAVAYSTVLGDPKWRAFDCTPTFEWSVTDRIDILGAVTLGYTAQTESENTFEIRPALGTRIHITPHKRILTRLLLRYEQRNFKNLEADEWTQVWRPRARIESLIPINQSSYFKDKLWYGIVDAEWFFAKDDVDERFANRFRLRTGIGYRLSYSLRFEFVYTLQQSRNQVEDGTVTTDNIFRIRIKQYLRKSTPSVLGGTGN